MTKQLDKKYNIKRVRICGYSMPTMKIGDNFTAHIPSGKNKKDKEMFDKLVYSNQTVYFAKTRTKLVNQIKDFCKRERK
jgi:hypothetical protein